VTVPGTITQRPATREDAAAVADLLAADETALHGRPSRLTAIDVRSWWGRVDLEQSSWLLEEDGEIVAVGWFEHLESLGFHVGAVAPGAKGRGLGGELVTLAETRAAAAGATRVHTWSPAPDAAAAELFDSRGYHEVRRFYDMAIELTEPVPEPSLPGGLAVEVFTETDARAFHDALDEAFQDHWEHHPRPFEQWWDEKRSAPDYDPTLWFLIRDGGEVAATIRNDPERNGGGYVGGIGVRRPWRGRGLGKALLLHTFAEFQRRGQTRVTLGVDAENPTGATELYERVGMHVETEAVVFEKALA
jgi:mycothiol synthase